MLPPRPAWRTANPKGIVSLIRLDGTNANQVQLLLGDGTKYPSEGTLQFRDVSVDPTTATVILRMVFPNTNGVLLPGMFVRAVVKEGVNDQAILIPQQAVSRDPKGNPLALIVDASGKVGQRILGLLTGRLATNGWSGPGLRLATRSLSKGCKKCVQALRSKRFLSKKVGDRERNHRPKQTSRPQRRTKGDAPCYRDSSSSVQSSPGSSPSS